MKALQYRTFGVGPEIVELPKPIPGPGEVLLRVTAAGVCHSDQFLMSLPAEGYLFGELPLTLGHEGAGVVEAVGPGVARVSVGEAVLVYGPWGCGRCHACAQGRENYCMDPGDIRAPGLGSPGSMAEYMVVDDARHLVPLGDLDPVQNVSLTDAGLTPYHAIKRSIPHLGAGTFAVVIGVGGLGHAGIQILRAMTGATIIAVDVSSEKIELATAVGAHHVVISGAGAAEAIRALTGQRGAHAVFDFVGMPVTAKLAGEIVGTEGEVSIVGVGGGAVAVGFATTAFDVSVRAPYWGSRSELLEVLELARRGQLVIETEIYSLEEGPRVYEKLAAGMIRGRAVLVPNH